MSLEAVAAAQKALLVEGKTSEFGAGTKNYFITKKIVLLTHKFPLVLHM